MRSEALLALIALQVDHLELHEELLLEFSRSHDLLLHSELEFESSRVLFRPYPFSVHKVHCMKSLDLFET